MTTPHEILQQEFLSADHKTQAEASANSARAVPPVRFLKDLEAPDTAADPNELIARRFLCRGGIMLLVGPTGIGKSSFVMQLAIHLCAGTPLMGICPGASFADKGMRVLLVQAENDEGDLAEMRDGVLRGCNISEEQQRLVNSNFMVCSICDRTGAQFSEALAGLMREHGPFDVVIVDPAFAFLGADSNSQRDVSHFMRTLLTPVVQEHKVGLLLVHHSNKPLHGKEKSTWAAGDFAYLGAGSAEWVNAARAVLAIRSLGSDRVFELRAAKRGRRLGWTDEAGLPTVSVHIAHHDDPQTIAWRKATETEIQQSTAAPKPGRPRACKQDHVLRFVAEHPGCNQQLIKTALSDQLTCSPNAVQNAIVDAVNSGTLSEKSEGRTKQYDLTTDGTHALGPTVSECVGKWK